MRCPSCGREFLGEPVECPGCGIVLAKWGSRTPRPRPSTPVPPSPAASPSARRTPSIQRLLLIVLLGVGGAAILAGGYWYVKIRPRVAYLEGRPLELKTSRERSVRLERSTGLFDSYLELSARPMGVSWNGCEFVVANGSEPWGFLRIKPSGSERFLIQKIPVGDPVYKQRMDIGAVAWNGKNYVGYTSGSWVRANQKNVFTIHDPNSLQIVDWKPAPELLGCLAWDGRGYWASTRRNTEAAAEPVWLYRLDANFAVSAKFTPPAVGCQGLTWDGEHLWFTDVFSGQVYVLDVSGPEPRVIEKIAMPFGYVSGTAFDGSHVWVAEYADNRLHRMSTRRKAEPVLASLATPPMTSSQSDSDLRALKTKLRSESWSERMSAESELQNRGVPIDFARRQDSFAKEDPEDTGVFDFQVEIRDGTLYASWDAWFGELLFNQETGSSVISVPKFARYEITVKGGTLTAPVERQFEAQLGHNLKRNIVLAEGLGKGKYDVSLFIHVQYRAPSGQDRILNHSGPTLTVEQ